MDFKNCCIAFFDIYSQDPKVLSRRTPKSHSENLQALKKFLIECRPWLIEDFTLIKGDTLNDDALGAFVVKLLNWKAFVGQ